ncbi:MAG: biotin transporter BioY [Bacillota bacterium]|nr:biotin transporter BioY [Bacillota bacterium]
MMTAGKQTYSNPTWLVLCGLFAALTAICSFITIPLGFTPIPLNLGTLAVFLTGGILGKKYGSISIIVYVLLGAAGVPVFSGFRGGFSVLVGPTGGYIAGYIAAVFLIGLILDKWFGKVRRSEKRRNTKDLALCALSMIVGLTVCYALGTAWFMFSTGTDLWASLIACVIPFLPGDAIKILAASILVRKLRPILR